MLFYHHTTHVKLITKITRKRLIPRPHEIVVNSGQNLTPVQVIAKTPKRVEYAIVSAAEELGWSVDEVMDNLKVKKGQKFRKGTTLIKKQGLFGRETVVKSPVDGILVDIDKGNLIILKKSLVVEIRALMRSTVVSVDQSVVLETTGAMIEGVWDSGREGIGKLSIMSRRPSGILHPEDVDHDLRGQVLAAGKIVEIEPLRKAEESGVRGIIVGSMPASILSEVAKFNFPIIITDGIGDIPMATPIYELLEQMEDKETTLYSARTSDESYRPLIAIPTLDAQVEDTKVQNVPIAQGQKVRILRTPHMGLVGTIQNVYTHGKTTEIGSRTPGADVVLSDGQIVFVPSVNLDLLL